MSYEIEARNVIVSRDFGRTDFVHPEPDEAEGRGQISPTLVVIGLVLGLLVVAYGWPVSIYCLGAALITFLLHRVRARLGGREASGPLSRRLLAGLVCDTRSAALMLTLGLAAVWLVQILLNLFADPANPDAIGAAELHLYGLAERVSEAGTAKYMLVGLFLAVFCSVLASSRWPLIALGQTRKVLSGAIAFLAAASSFSFVAPVALAENADAAIDAIRARIANDLDHLARTRSEQAALQWIAAEFTREATEHPETRRRWRAYFSEIQDECRDQQDCDMDQLLIQLARQRTSPRTAYDPYPSSAVRRPSAWLPEYRGSIVNGPPALVEPIGDFAPEPPSLHIDERVRRSGDLIAMRRSAGEAVARAAAARDAIRGVVVEAVGDLLGPNYGRLADQVVDVWRNAVLDVLATEGEGRIARRLRALNFGVTNIFAAPTELAGLSAPGFPLESPHVALARGQSVEGLVQSDWDTMYARETSPAAREMVARQALEFERVHRRFGRGTYRAPPRFRVPFR